MKHFNLPRSLTVICAAIAGLGLIQTGCTVLEPKADNTKLYVLRPQPGESTNAPTPAKLPAAIRIGPGRLAAYLDVTPIVVQNGVNLVKQLDQHHWAEPLSKGISRVLAENLAQRLQGARVIIYPEPANDTELEIRYTVNQLEGALNGPIEMNISWQIVNLSSGETLRAGILVGDNAHTRHPSDVPAYVERMSAAIGVWADGMAAAINSL